MVAAISSMTTPRPSSRSGLPHHQTPTRRPLPPSADAENLVPHRRPKSREVTSRYLSGVSNSNANSSLTPAARPRGSSPIRPRTPGMTAVPATPMPAIKRAQSVERRRAATPIPAPVGDGVGSAAARMLCTSSRRLSVSFQGESFSLKVSKAKPAPAPAPAPAPVVRRATPERRKITPSRGDGRADQVDNSKSFDQHRWPARLRPDNFMSRSLDMTGERKKLGGSGSNSSAVRDLQKSMVGLSNDGKRFPVSGSTATKASLSLASVVLSDSVSLSSDSVSSGSTSGGGGRRSLMIPSKCWQDNNASKLKPGRTSELVSPSAKGTTPKGIPLANYFTPRRLSTDSPLSSPKSLTNSRSLSSPQRGAIRAASPSKLSTSYTTTPARGMLSPARVRTGATGTTNSSSSSASSFLSFVADARRGRIGENKIDDAHFLRLLYNRLLQWRFVNARVDAASTVQILTAEKCLCNAWESTSQLRNSVRDKKMLLWMLRLDLKLLSILKAQMKHLNEWTTMDMDHLNSLLGLTAALKATTLRLPVIDGARADVQNLKEAISSAVDVMQSMTSSVCPLSIKVGKTNTLVSELSNMVAKEQGHLDECKRLLSGLAVMQVTDCSLRTNSIQLSGTTSKPSMTTSKTQ